MKADRGQPIIVRSDLVNWISGNPTVIEDSWYGQCVVVYPRWNIGVPGRSFAVVDAITGAHGVVNRDTISDSIPIPEPDYTKHDEDHYRNVVRCSAFFAELRARSDSNPEEEAPPLSERSYAILSSMSDSDEY